MRYVRLATLPPRASQSERTFHPWHQGTRPTVVSIPRGRCARRAWALEKQYLKSVRHLIGRTLLLFECVISPI